MKYKIGFIGDNTYASLPKSKLSKYSKEFNNYSNTKKKTLLESIKLANHMLEGKNNFDDITNNKEIKDSQNMKSKFILI